MRRAGIVGLVVALAVPLTGVLPGTTAAAAGPTAATMTADHLPTWQTDGIVWASEYVNGVVYVGGAFSNVRPPGAAPGSQQTPRANFAAFDAVTGALLPCAPSFTLGTGTPTVRSLEASPDGTRLYVGGSFSGVNGTGVANLVSLNTSNCALTATSAFRRPSVTAAVRSVSASATTVYFGGDFGTVDGQTRTRFASVTSAGVLTSASVSLNATVRAVVAAPEAGRVFIGGDFSTVNGASVRGLVALNATTGAVVQTFPGWIPNNSVVRVMTRDATNFYVGAEGTGGGVFDGRIAGVIATGAQIWKDNCLGATMALAVHQDVLYSGSHAHDCSTTPGGFPDGRRHHLLAQPTNELRLLPWFPDTNGGIGEALGPRTMVTAGNQLWVGGEFTTVNGVAQQGLTRFATSPDTGYVNAPILNATSQMAGKVKIAWTAGYDRDDDAITYELFRVGTTAPIYTTTVNSREWNRPRLFFVDNIPPGQTASYNIRTSDGTNVSPKGATVTVTSSSQTVAYASDVWLDNPVLNWKLDETLGATAADSSGLGRTGTHSGGYLRGTASALESGAGRSTTFTTSSGRLHPVSTTRLAGPQVYSVELWFRTSTTRGGKLIGFGNSRTGTSTQYDRHIYMNNSGNLIFGNFTGTTQTIKSPATYRNNAWHHAVGTLGPTGMRLYVDGLQVAANPSVTSAEPFFGYWKVANDQLDSWPERPQGNNFAGGIDEVAVYDHQLSAQRVFAHFRAGRPSAVNDTQAPTVPTGLAASSQPSGVALTWNASSDNLLLAGYRVHRSTTPNFTPTAATQIAEVAAPTTGYTDPGVAPGTYHYRVVAFDGVGNVSNPSATASVTVVDSQPPSAPGTTSAIAYGQEVDVSWLAATDNIGVAEYDVHRTAGAADPLSSGNRVGTVTGLSFTETSVPLGTWHYRVVARDTSGQAGPPSTAASATTQDATSSIDFGAADALAPAPTFTTTPGATSTIAGATLVAPDDPRFTYRGAGGFQFGTTFPDTLMYQPTSRYPNTWGLPSVYSVEFTTDAAQFEIYTKYLNAAQSLRIKVDGQRTTDLAQPLGGTTLGGRHVIKVDFGSSQTRRVTVEGLYWPFAGVYLPPGALLTKSPPLTTRWMVLGDSISGGSGENTGLGLGTWILRAANYLNWDDPWNQAIGGTGYVADDNGQSVPFGGRVATDIAPYDPDRIVVWGGYNDMLLPQAQIASAASALYANLASAAPQADVYVVGPWSPSGSPGASLTATDATVRTQAAAAGLPFISPITGAVYDGDGDLAAQQRPWITAANAAQYIGADGRHPNDAGHAYIARRMALALEQVADLSGPPGDNTPPTAPTGLATSVTGSDVGLTWTAATDNVDVASYEVHRSTTSGFTPDSGTKVSEVTGTSATVTGVPVGTSYFKVIARDTSGNAGPPSAQASATVAAPQVTLSATASADTYVHSAAQTTNFGTSTSMTVDGDPEQVAFLRFAVPEAPDGMSLIGAALRVRTTTNSFAGSVEGHTVAVADSAWDEATTLWGNRPGVPGPTLGTMAANTQPATTYDTALNLATVSGSLGAGLDLAIVPAGADSFQINSRQAGSGQPELVLVFE